MGRILFGVPAVGLLVLAMFALMPCIATCGDADDVVTEAVRGCPRAVELLGDDPRPARLGLACGTTETEGSYGRASWGLPYTGSRARGRVSYAAEKRASDWQLDAASLEVDGETIDLLACVRAAQVRRTAQQPAQTNADATARTFHGKVLRSTHATLSQASTCRGVLERERGSAFARVKVECDPSALGGPGAGGAIVLYDGTGNFTLDVRDPTRPDDDRVELDDSKTSDADGTPGCRLSSSGARGTLTIWDSSPAYEIVVEL
jgi:hypothetical protein